MRALLSVAGMSKQTVSSTNDSIPVNSTHEKNADSVNSEIRESSSHDTQVHSAAVHALNILRALYRDSRLGEQIVPFIPEGVEIAVHGFSASLWPVSSVV